MKITLITLLTSLTLTLSAQVPDWTKYTCDGNNYNMYTELSKGKAVVLNFSSAWSAGSPAMAMESENLWQNMMSENVKVFSFLNEDQDFNEADCDDESQCAECSGDCDSDDECAPGLRCLERSTAGYHIPGCNQATEQGSDLEEDDDCCHVDGEYENAHDQQNELVHV